MASPLFPVTPGSVALPILALIAVIIDTPPLIWHIRNRNLAASSLVFWVLVCNFMNFINALIWPTDDIQNWWLGYGLCDIEVKLMIAVTFGVVGCLACIMRTLANVLDTKNTILNPSTAQRQRQTFISFLFCFGGPIYSMMIHYVVQPNRYYIFSISGCTTSYDNSWPKFVLILLWPPLICLLVFYYSVLVIIRMRRYRNEFSAILSSSNSKLTKSRFLRMFLLSLTLILILLPTQCYVLYQNSTVPLVSYSWSLVHGSDWHNVILVSTGGSVIFDRWIQTGFGLAIFVFFGFGQDAQAMYRRWLQTVGFGRIFPSLGGESRREEQPRSTNSSGAHSSSSRARMLRKDRPSRGSFMSFYNRSTTDQGSVHTLSPTRVPDTPSHPSLLWQTIP